VFVACTDRVSCTQNRSSQMTNYKWLFLCCLVTAVRSARDVASKRDCEYSYWERKAKEEQGHLANAHYAELMTLPFKLTKDAFHGKKVLDVGCGPRGSLEWLQGCALLTACADPLANDYGKLGAHNHSAVYVKAGAENLPWIDQSFDVVTSINNMDHVDNPAAALREVHRVLRPGGTFLITVDIHPTPTRCEPQALGWELEAAILEAGFKSRRIRKVPFKANRGTIKHDVEDTVWTPPTPRTRGWFVGHFIA